MYGSGRGVGEALAVQGIEQRLDLPGIEGQWRARSRRPSLHGVDQREAVYAGPMSGRRPTRQTQNAASRASTQREGELMHGGHQGDSVLPVGLPSKEASFF